MPQGVQVQVLSGASETETRICMLFVYRYVFFMLYYILVKHIILYRKYSILKYDSDTNSDTTMKETTVC